MSPKLFVYGTLKPGLVRWPMLEPRLEPGAPVVDDVVEGRLWATPWGWPALTPGSDTVRGVLVELATDGADEALADLDAVEGVGAGLFDRKQTVTRSGTTCWVYEWPHDTDGFEPGPRDLVMQREGLPIGYLPAASASRPPTRTTSLRRSREGAHLPLRWSPWSVVRLRRNEVLA